MRNTKYAQVGSFCLFAALLVANVTFAQIVNHWDLDHDTGLEAVDRISCGAAGSLVGFDNLDDAHWVEGIYGNGLDLGSDGIFGNRINTTMNAVGNEGNGFTVMMWINPGDAIFTAGEYQLLGTPGDVVGFTIMNFNNGEVAHDRVLLFWDGNLPNLHVGTTTLEPGTWYHVAITSGGPGGEKKYYIDGQEETQTLFLPAQGGTEGNHPVNNSGWANGPGALGALANGARGHDSILDDVRIYEGELSAEEIQTAMEEEPAPLPQVANIFPEPGTVDHNPAEGLSFDVLAQGAGVTIPTDGISLVLNGEDVSEGLSIGGTDAEREVSYEGLVENIGYTGLITITDSNGLVSCTEITFGTILETVPGLVHYFPLDHNDGTNAIDLGSASNGTLNNFDAGAANPWEQAVCDNGLNFGSDGSLNNFVTFQSNEVNAFENGGFTVSMWLRPGPQILTPGEYQLLATPGDVVGFTIMNFAGEVTHDRVLLFWDGNLPGLHVGTTSLEPGVWYHVAITSTGVGGEKLYYVNGELEDQALFLPSQGGIEGEHLGNVDGWGAGTAALGALANGARAHDSIFDDVRIYNRALDEGEVFDVMQECEPKICDPLVLGDLNVEEGNTFHDATQGIELEVSTPNDGFSIEQAGISITLNGEEISGDITLGGSPTNRVITYTGLEADTSYTLGISITDDCATLQRNIQFGTFTACEGDDPNLVHHFPMDEIEGLTTFDCVGGSLGSLINFPDDGFQWRRGQIDGGLAFIGVDGRVNSRVAAPFNAVNTIDEGGLTVAMWINPGETINNIGEHQLFMSPNDSIGFSIMNFDGEVRHDRVLLFWDGNLPNLHVGTTTLEPGTWYHVVITTTGLGGVKTYYINGEEEEATLFLPSQGGIEGDHIATSEGWAQGIGSIGAGNAGDRNHDTTFDDFRIYNVALTLEEVQALYDGEIIEPGDNFRRGDTDGNGALEITDPINNLSFQFLGTFTPPCMDAADFDDNGKVEITDPIANLSHQFLGTAAPAPPGKDTCGVDPTPDDPNLPDAELGCENPPENC